MPPRKRAASAPKAKPDEPIEPLTANEDAGLAADEPASELPDSGPADDGSSDAGDPVPPDDPDDEPEGSDDPQTADAPCIECFPGGWPAQSNAVGCTHGTWQRD
ncbi:hypothetical protein ACH4UM_19045 [Streptomyces sp. NPDC020801]|uniref:hypothetical protein n=1 Tax=Streptomyces sp. NPDC020801 TaxID=3365093 RepID=UPI00378B64E0